MKKVVIFGSGDHSKVVFSEIIQLKKFSVLGFIDNFNKKGKIIESHKGNKYKILGKIEFLKNIKNISGIIGVGSNYKRKTIVEDIFNYTSNDIVFLPINFNRLIKSLFGDS